MSVVPQSSRWTVQQYLDYERESDSRHEFLGGQVLDMAGASERHNQLSSALNFLLYGQLLDRPCQVFQSDMRVQADDSAYFYPDIVAVCGQAQYMDESRDTLLNPTVVIEVLSPSTEDFDRGRKFKQYRGITSLQDYVLVSQKQMQVEPYSRQGTDTWLLRDLSHPDDTLNLSSTGCTLLLKDLYRKINFLDED